MYLYICISSPFTVYLSCLYNHPFGVKNSWQVSFNILSCMHNQSHVTFAAPAEFKSAGMDVSLPSPWRQGWKLFIPRGREKGG